MPKRISNYERQKIIWTKEMDISLFLQRYVKNQSYQMICKVESLNTSDEFLRRRARSSQHKNRVYEYLMEAKKSTLLEYLFLGYCNMCKPWHGIVTSDKEKVKAKRRRELKSNGKKSKSEKAAD
jgi:hypothetical protein